MIETRLLVYAKCPKCKKLDSHWAIVHSEDTTFPNRKRGGSALLTIHCGACNTNSMRHITKGQFDRLNKVYV